MDAFRRVPVSTAHRRARDLVRGLGAAVSAFALLAWHAARLTLLALLVTLEPVVRLVLTLLTVVLLAAAAVFAAGRPGDSGAPLMLVAAACGCAFALLAWYAAIAALQTRPRP